MALSTEIKYASLDHLFLDPLNPRLGRKNRGGDVTQEQVLEIMKDYTLDELAVSFLEGGGFWTNEALLVVEETLYGKTCLVVVEGNRRLAALKFLYNAYKGNALSTKWREIAESAETPPYLFERIPYLIADSREDIQAFLGFRHVTGIREWDPDEKAEFIAHLIDDQGKSYAQVMRMIGSKTPVIRLSYIAFRLLSQIEEEISDFPTLKTEGRFSVMYLSLRTRGVQQYLQIDIMANPSDVKWPVPKKQIENLADFAMWLFGTDSQPPLFTDSRLVDKFGQILQSEEAVLYLKRTKRPSFDLAFQIAGGDEPEISELIETAADNVELSLTRVHHHKSSPRIHKAVKRLGVDVNQLLVIFPSIQEELEKEE